MVQKGYVQREEFPSNLYVLFGFTYKVQGAHCPGGTYGGVVCIDEACGRFE